MSHLPIEAGPWRAYKDESSLNIKKFSTCSEADRERLHKSKNLIFGSLSRSEEKKFAASYSRLCSYSQLITSSNSERYIMGEKFKAVERMWARISLCKIRRAKW